MVQFQKNEKQGEGRKLFAPGTTRYHLPRSFSRLESSAGFFVSGAFCFGDRVFDHLSRTATTGDLPQLTVAGSRKASVCPYPQNLQGGTMKCILVALLVLVGTAGIDMMGSSTIPTPFGTETAEAAVKYVQGYTRSNGTYVSGHYKDTSGDGNPYNNASYLGYN